MRDIRTWMARGWFSLLGETAVLYGYRIIKEACETEEGRAEAQKALDRFWPIALDLFGRSDSKRSPQYIKWGLRNSTNADLRSRFSHKMRAKIETLGLTVPDDTANRKYM